MKFSKIVSSSILLLMVSIASLAQTGNVKIRGTRFTYPIVRKWIAEFGKTYPSVHVELAPRTVPEDSIDLSIAAFELSPADLKGSKEGVVLNRYIQLPIANTQHPNLKQFQTKGLTESDFKKIYFTANTQPEIKGQIAPIVVYRRETAACAGVSFAKHFHSEFKDIIGKGVAGDDKDLLIAVKKDPLGFSYNNLGFVYDLKTRQVVDSISVIPIDLNENGKVDSNEQIYGTLDQVLAYAEKTDDPKIPAEVVNVIFNKTSKNVAAALFLNWILTEGQQFNHEYGYLNLKKEIVVRQKAIVAESFKN